MQGLICFVGLYILKLASLTFGQQCIGTLVEDGLQVNATIILSVDDDECGALNFSTSRLALEAQDVTDRLNNQYELKIGIKVLPKCVHSNLKLSETIIGSVRYNTCESEIYRNDRGSIAQIAAAVLPTQEYLQENFGMTEDYVPMNIISYSDYGNSDHGFTSGSSLYFRAKAMVKLAVELNWDVAYLYSGNDTASAYMSEVLSKLAAEELICILNPTHIDASLESINGAFVIDSSLGAISTIGNQSTTGSRVWIVTLSDGANLTLPIDASVSKAVVFQVSDSVTTAAKVKSAVENAYKAFVASCSVTGCDEYNTLANRMRTKLQDQAKSINGDDDSETVLYRLSAPDYTFLISSGGAVVGSFSNGTLTLELTPISRDLMSLCIDDACGKICRQQIEPRNYIFIPGDYIILYTAPIHQVGATDNLFRCDKFSIPASHRAAAMVFAIEQLREKLGMAFGLLAIDSCISIQATLLKLTAVLGGREKFCNGEGCFSIDRLLAVIGDYSSHVTVEEQHLLQELDILHIAYGGATQVLDDKTKFPLFMRTQPSITRLADDYVTLLNELNDEGHLDLKSYILIHTDSLWGYGGELINQKLQEAGYCNVHDGKLVLKHRGQEEPHVYFNLLDEIQKNNPSNLLFVFHGEEAALTQLLTAIAENAHLKNWWKNGKFMLLPEIYEGPDLFEKYGDLLAGSIAFKLDSGDLQDDTFRAQLNHKRPDPHDVNPWFNKMYQMKFECKLRGDFSVTQYENPCTYSDTHYNNLEPEAYAIFSIVTTYAAALGFKSFYDEKKCDTPSICMEAVHQNPEQLKRKIINQRIGNSDNLTAAETFLPFNSEGDSNIAYIVRSLEADLIDASQSKYEYRYIDVYEFRPAAVGSGDDLSRPDKTKVPLFYTWEDGHSRAKPVSPPCKEIEKATPSPGISTEATVAFVLVGVLLLVVGLLVIYVVVRRRKERRRRAMEEVYHKTMAATSGSSTDFQGLDVVSPTASSGYLDQSMLRAMKRSTSSNDNPAYDDAGHTNEGADLGDYSTVDD